MKRFALSAGLTILFGALLATAARADDDDDDDDDDRGKAHHERGGDKRGRASATLRTTPQWAAYQAECGSCHLAFPPSMLPARSWTALLDGLDNHFKENAEVDAATRKTLAAWLVANAGSNQSGAPLRITQLSWWRHKHSEVPVAVFQRKAITSPANCGACHAGANQGAFGEHDVRIPRDAPAPR